MSRSSEPSFTSDASVAGRECHDATCRVAFFLSTFVSLRNETWKNVSALRLLTHVCISHEQRQRQLAGILCTVKAKLFYSFYSSIKDLNCSFCNSNTTCHFHSISSPYISGCVCCLLLWVPPQLHQASSVNNGVCCGNPRIWILLCGTRSCGCCPYQ